MKLRRTYWIIILTSLPIFALDVWTKRFAEISLGHEGQTYPILGWFNFTLVYNYSAAFGMFGGFPQGVRSAFLLILVPVVLIFLWRGLVLKFRKEEILGPVAVGFVFGGAIGNMVDRIPDGRVTDFIDWHYPSTGKCLPLFHHFTSSSCHWPVFNFADCAILAALILLIMTSFVSEWTVQSS